MIEISHKQARHLIREGIDSDSSGGRAEGEGSSVGRRITTEQWSALQAHLETCAECRAYRDRLTQVERDLRRVLQLHWNPVRGPGKATGERVTIVRKARQQRRKMIRYILGGVVGLVLLFLYRGYRMATAPPPRPTPIPTIAGAPVEPTPARNLFRGVVAFERYEGDSSDIYLLNPGSGDAGPELVNLTDHPAQDTNPAWSPDGEWLAFLSDRDVPGKPEVYVIHVAGSRLTRLTAEPTVEWTGPLSWSSDGRWIALPGRRTDSNDTWIYLVPLNGSGARSVGFTRGSPGALQFSPILPLLAYQTDTPPGSGIMVFNLSFSSFVPVTWDDNRNLSMRAGSGGVFDWSPDGTRLVYATDGSYDMRTGEPVCADTCVAQIKITQALDPFTSRLYDSRANQIVENIPGAGQIRSITFAPDEEGRVIAYLLDEEQDGCFTVHLRQTQSRDARAREIGGLCVEGGITRASWTADSDWLVMVARRPDETSPGLYALRISNDLVSINKPYFERLVDFRFDPGTERAMLPVPQVRQAGSTLGIIPRAARAEGILPPPADPGRGLPGQLVFNWMQAARTTGQIMRSAPDGSRPQPLTGTVGENICPVLSPDGSQIAFLSDRDSAHPGVNEVYRMGARGQDLTRLTRPVFPVIENSPDDPYATPLPRYGCPSWSPDGKRIAAVVRTGRGDYLAVIPAQTGESPRFIPVEAVSQVTGPVWTPDGEQVLLVNPADGDQEPRIISVSVQDGGRGTPVVQEIARSDGWDEVYGMAFLDEQTLAYIAATYRANQPTGFELRLQRLDGEEPVQAVTLPESYLYAFFGSSHLDRLADGRLGFAIRSRVDAPVKARILLYDPEAESLAVLADVKDILYDTAWSPDGRWMVYAAESGLWALEIEPALENRSGPAMIHPGEIFEVDWK